MLTRLLNTLKKIARSPYSLYAAIVVIGIAAYAAHIPELGFYWDDWPWVWSLHINGAQGMFKIDEYHRPLTGIVLYLGGLFAGESPALWQVYTLALRLLGAAALAWMLNILWQNKRQRIAWVVTLFLIYPGFNQQFVAVNNSRHIFPLVTFFLSLGFTLKSLQAEKNRPRHAVIALLLSLTTMLTSEYFYGLELIRPVLIWLLVRRKEKDLRASLLSALKAWLPYALLIVAVFGWRYSISTQRNYSITIFERLDKQLIANAAQDLWIATIGAWGSIFNWDILADYSGRIHLLYWAVVIATASGTLIYFGLIQQDDAENNSRIEIWILGVSALAVSLIPFWVTGLDPKLGFPEDRLLLPAALGASLLLAALIDLLKPHALKLILLAGFVGLAAGSQNQNALVYRSAWASTGSFFQQLSTRAPSLPANTTLLSNQFAERSTDNSLIAPLNWTYAPNFTDGTIPLQILYVDLRFGRDNPTIDEDLFRSKAYMNYIFEGSLAQTLVLFYEPPACLQLVDPQNPLRKIPAPVDAVVQYANPKLVLAESDLNATLPTFFADSNVSKTWCAYFQQADLARQRGDWETIAQLGDEAFGAGKTPNHPSERIPFIEGYAHLGVWEKALKITQEAPKREGMFCAVWARIQADTPASTERDAALQKIDERFDCDW